MESEPIWKLTYKITFLSCSPEATGWAETKEAQQVHMHSCCWKKFLYFPRINRCRSKTLVLLISTPRIKSREYDKGFRWQPRRHELNLSEKQRQVRRLQKKEIGSKQRRILLELHKCQSVIVFVYHAQYFENT